MQSTFEKPVLVYSDFCTYCQNFAALLVQHPEILQQFVKINIDIDLSTGDRPQMFYDLQKALDFKISEVPTIVVDSGQYVLTGEEAFKWLEYQIKKGQEEKSLQAFNPNEMGSFSDNYANLKNDNCASQSFKFLSDPEAPIHTPQEAPPATVTQFSKGGMQKSSEIDKRLQDLMTERESMLMRVPKPPNSRIDFTTGKMNCA
ncbi:thioredoxin [bacterium]|nr:thioredoxin [bacterium]NDC93786.1 thioredoxin [bacterium]NDD83119.1 thioredoxin [bacterium]NDG29652.1 thioredoxin [bacterium]